MPKVSQVTTGFRIENTAGEGGVTTTRQKSFRIIRDRPDERIEPENACKIQIGSRDAENPALRCSSWTLEPEGDSRMVWIATFTYTWQPHVFDSEQDNGSPFVPPAAPPQLDANGVETSFPPPSEGGSAGSRAPDIRPANWYIQSSLVDAPVYSWESITGPFAGQKTAPINPAGDLYEGVVKLEPVVSIHVQQFMWPDPTMNAMHVGKVNKETWTLGQMVMPPRSVMLRAMNTQPHVEPFAGNIYRGWMATYEFMYRRNYVGDPVNAECGWDWTQPQTGFNEIAAFGGQKLPILINVEGQQVAPSQPVPLSNNGAYRTPGQSPEVIVTRHRIYEELDFDLLNIRLQ